MTKAALNSSNYPLLLNKTVILTGKPLFLCLTCFTARAFAGLFFQDVRGILSRESQAIVDV